MSVLAIQTNIATYRGCPMAFDSGIRCDEPTETIWMKKKPN